MKHEHITTLMAFNANLQLAHWQADTLSSVHVTLGNLYEQMTDLTDQLAEIMLGKDGGYEFEETDLHLHSKADVKALLLAGLDAVAEARAELTAGADDDLLNVLAEMSGAINRTKYLLKV